MVLAWHPAPALLLGAYLFAWLALAVFGLHRLHLIRMFRRCAEPTRPREPSRWPFVTIQLPVYNERYVVERLLDAASKLDYPRERLEIQLLDDSTDLTSDLAARKVEALRARGLQVAHVRRAHRTGFKAGALQHGLEWARGEFLAVFDADFVPPPFILKALVPYFQDPRVGVVQARWQHLNRDFSMLARAQALSLDGHFLIEHTARMGSGRFLNFNGTAGLLRKTCILDAGGWQSDTLTEDLDLSYRAQLLGWRVVFASRVECPGELPVEMNAFKAQQHRWVKGSMQVARKLLPAVWRSGSPLPVKVEATFHLTYNLAYALLLLLSVIVYPVVLARYETRSLLFAVADTVLFTAATASVLVYFAYAQRLAGRNWLGSLRDLPYAMALGVGLAVNNTRAVFEGLVGGRGDFHRTPKFRIERRGDGWRGKRYAAPVSGWALLEIALGGYFAWAIVSLARAHFYAPIPFFGIYLFGFLYVGALSLAHASSLAPRATSAGPPARRGRSRAPAHTAPAPPYSTHGTQAGRAQTPVAR
jgi:cellulose synthase/poly-beta-1,6-N-acetylglucosamine synthase-like glycosyltransferase